MFWLHCKPILASSCTRFGYIVKFDYGYLNLFFFHYKVKVFLEISFQMQLNWRDNSFLTSRVPVLPLYRFGG